MSDSTENVAAQVQSPEAQPVPPPSGASDYRMHCRRVSSLFGNTVLSGAIFRIGQSGQLLWASDSARVVLGILNAFHHNAQNQKLNQLWQQYLWSPIDKNALKPQVHIIRDPNWLCSASVYWHPKHPTGLTVSLWNIKSASHPGQTLQVDPMWISILRKLNCDLTFKS
ncbi:hypothetical protein [Poriferisphaera corsica]|uniref:hypothetical protein n=1 Tax=Poriferisphaera corsica TaxID=2528020 RepID=UPI0011A249C1|nr:hypothetical protein [Poriferisphaera corsica]